GDLGASRSRTVWRRRRASCRKPWRRLAQIPGWFRRICRRPTLKGARPMSEFTVYSIPGSPFGRAVLATLEEKGADYRLMPVAPGAFRSPEHLARHPFGRVPVLEHDGFMLYET